MLLYKTYCYYMRFSSGSLQTLSKLWRDVKNSPLPSVLLLNNHHPGRVREAIIFYSQSFCLLTVCLLVFPETLHLLASSAGLPSVDPTVRTEGKFNLKKEYKI